MTGETDIEVIKSMLQKGREKLETARLMFENERYDDSVSRVYYTVFHTISAVLMSKKLHYSSHSQTIGAFNKEFVKPGIFPKTFTRTIQKLFNERHAGDYDLNSGIDEDIAEEDLQAVEEITSSCEEYLASVYQVPKDYWRK